MSADVLTRIFEPFFTAMRFSWPRTRILLWRQPRIPGSRAFRAAAHSGKPIDLLLTDVILPGTSGVQLAQRLATTHPRARVLYVSGYTADAIVHHGGHGANFAFISKPFSLPVLARKIRSILDAEQPQSTPAPSLIQGARK